MTNDSDLLSFEDLDRPSFRPRARRRGDRAAQRWWALILGATAALCAGRAHAADATSLAWFAGSWHCAGRFEANGKPIEARLRFDWNDAAGALVKHHDDEPPNPYHAVELWSGAGPRLTAAIVDAYSGTRVLTSAGWTQESLTWTRTVDAKPVERFAYTRESTDRMRVDWSTSRDGLTFKVGDTLSCERQVAG